MLVWEKSPGSAPLKLTLVMLRAALPELVRVIDCAVLLVPTTCVPNCNAAGESALVVLHAVVGDLQVVGPSVHEDAAPTLGTIGH